MDELITLLADLVIEEINHVDDNNTPNTWLVLGSSINSFINIYYHFGRRKQNETSNRLLTSKYTQTTISSSTETDHQSTSQKHSIKQITFYSDKQSGRTDKRNGYQQVTELIQQGQCNVLCCYRLNRLHRNLKMH